MTLTEQQRFAKAMRSKWPTACYGLSDGEIVEVFQDTLSGAGTRLGMAVEDLFLAVRLSFKVVGKK